MARLIRRLGILTIIAFFGVTGGLSAPGSAAAATGVTYYVSHGSGGSCAAGNLSTVAAALACAHADNPAANNPDTIFIARGAYNEHDLVVNANVMIIGQQRSAIIDARGLGRVFSISTGRTVTLDGLTLQNGSAQLGAGIDNNGTLTVQNSVITHNTTHGTFTTYALGGGLYDATGNLRIDNSTFSYNVARNGSPDSNIGEGAAAAGGAIFTTQGSPVITNSTFSHNSAIGTTEHHNLSSGPAAEGGALYADKDNLLIVQSVFDRNDATGSMDPYTPASSFGGGLFLSGIATEIDGSTISNNVAACDFGATGLDRYEYAWGGGIFRDEGTTLTLNLDQIVHNRTVIQGSLNVSSFPDIGEASEGAGLYDNAYSLQLNATAVSWNTADAGSFGIAGRGGGLFIGNRSANLLSSAVDGNVATGPAGRGGGIYWDSDYTLTLTATAVHGNSVPGALSDGGGIYRNHGTVLMDAPGQVTGNLSGGPHGTNNCYPLNGIPNCTG